MSEKLEPCPFCGCAVGLVTGFEYSTVRGDHALTCVFLDDEPVATAAEWNSRAQRDEGLAREAELQKDVADLKAKVQTADKVISLHCKDRKTLQQRLAEAKKLLHECLKLAPGPVLGRRIRSFLATPGCTDGEKPE